jgi:serine O-acetyltransferase
MTCQKLIFSDLKRISKSQNIIVLIRFFISNASFKITFWYRVGHFLQNKIGNSNNRATKLLLSIIYVFVFLIHKHNQYLTGIQIPFETKIGKSLFFAHFSCIIINSSAIIGDNCTIFQGVTIGSKRGEGVPVIGNNCVIAAGSKIIGDVKIGNNVEVGANAVVVKDIPDNAVVGGIPAKILNMNGEKICKLYLKL